MSTNYQHKPGQGSAWKNKDKTEDWHAAYRGKVMLPDGSLHYLDISPKKTQAGETFISVKIGNQVQGAAKPMDSHNTAKGNGYQPQGDDSDIPF